MKKISFVITAFASIMLAACGNKPAGTTAPVKIDSASATVAAPAPVIQKDTDVQVGSTKLDKTVYALFLSLKNKNRSDFEKLIPSRNEMNQLFLSLSPPDKIEQVKAKLAEEDISQKERKEIMVCFGRAIKRGDELKLDWSKLIYKGTTIDSAFEDHIKTYKGELTFSDGQHTFHIKYDDWPKMGNRYLLTNIYTPYQDTESSTK